MKKRNYIGIATTFHDPAIAIINPDGELVFAEGTERYLQLKRAINCMPDEKNRCEKLIKQYCDKDADVVIGTSWSDQYIRSSRWLYPFLKWGAGKAYSRDAQHTIEFTLEGQFAVNRLAGLGFSGKFISRNNDVKITRKNFNHHLAHAAFACHSSPFDEAVCAVIDGFGEDGSTGFYTYKGGKITPIKGIKRSSGSLGILYAVICEACGFDSFQGEEWKVMGMAPYGKFDQKIYDILASAIKLKDCTIERTAVYKSFFTDKPALSKPAPDAHSLDYADLAYTGQVFFTDTLSQLLHNLHRRGISDNLVLGGGCGLNSAANGKILQTTPFTGLHVPCAPADDGNAVGAALLAFYEDHPHSQQVKNIRSPYLGTGISKDTLGRVRSFGKLGASTASGKDIFKATAELLAQGKIIGWMQGKAEFGPRALGNRSIIADPRNPRMKDMINGKVKFREEFRPFAPSILHEHGDEYFEHYQETMYMERALMFKKEVMHKVPAVVHEDGTGRLQTVKKEFNERYYQLITEFYKLTGVPIILNTSFNVMGKPIIHTVEDALATFFTTGLDALVIDDELIDLSTYSLTASITLESAKEAIIH